MLFIHSFRQVTATADLKKKTTRKTAPVSNPPNVNHEQTWTKKNLFLKNYFYKVRKRKWDLTSFDINPKIKRLFRSPLSVSGLFAPLNARITHTNSFTFIYFCSTYERELCCVKTTRYSQRGPAVCRLFVSFFFCRLMSRWVPPREEKPYIPSSSYFPPVWDSTWQMMRRRSLTLSLGFLHVISRARFESTTQKRTKRRNKNKKKKNDERRRTREGKICPNILLPQRRRRRLPEVSVEEGTQKGRKKSHS